MASTSNQIVRRKFSLTQDTAEELDRIAEERYASNRSQAVRASIIDHSRTIAGEGEFNIRQLNQHVEELLEEIDQLQKSIEEGNSEAKKQINATDEHSKGDSLDEYAVEVYGIIETGNEESVSIQSIIDQTDLTFPQTQRSLAYLLDKEMIGRSEQQDKVRYNLK